MLHMLICTNGLLLNIYLASIGQDDGIGVESLSASGMIAGETSEAYNDIVTISMVNSSLIT